MPLTISRRRFESFTATWPNGRVANIRLAQITPTVLVSVNGGAGRELPLTISGDTEDDPLVVDLGNRLTKGQVAIRCTAPKSIQIQRDDAKFKGPR